MKGMYRVEAHDDDGRLIATRDVPTKVDAERQEQKWYSQGASDCSTKWIAWKPLEGAK